MHAPRTSCARGGAAFTLRDLLLIPLAQGQRLSCTRAGCLFSGLAWCCGGWAGLVVVFWCCCFGLVVAGPFDLVLPIRFSLPDVLPYFF